MNLIFFEDLNDKNLYPLTLTRPPADLRVGILTIAEKWVLLLGAESHGFETREYLSPKYKKIENPDLYINGKVLPNPNILQAVKTLQPNESLQVCGVCIAYKGDASKAVEVDIHIDYIHRPYHIFKLNAQEIVSDFALITQGKSSETLSESNRVIGNHPIFLEKGAKVECAILNSTDGPIYLGKDSEIMEGSLVRGPFAMGEGAKLKLGTKVYGGSTLGPFCNVGGEINNIVMQGYSNKGHDGFLGNAVLGEWCNIGADSNCSNLKNTYDDVKVWNYHTRRFDKSGQQFCGLIMGDHSKCGINTMFNTGTIVGVACNLFGAGFPRQFVPDFSWGGANGFVTHKMPAVEKTAQLMMVRRHKEYDDIEQGIMRYLFEMTADERTWEKEENL